MSIGQRMRMMISLGCAGLLAACATGPSPSEVTRFHLGQPIARGLIVVEPAPGGTLSGLEFQTYAQAVARELTRLGFEVEPKLERSEQVATVDVSQGIRTTPIAARSPVTIGVGAGTAGDHVGIGIGTSFGIGKKTSNEVQATTLSVQIKRRSDATVFWEGRAATESRAEASSAADLASQLAAALFKDFPGETGKTVIVK